MRILIVEDALDVASAMVATMEAIGFAVDHATNVADGVAFTHVHDYAVIVLDLGLPDGDGRQVLDELRKRGNATPVLVLTARFSVDARVDALDAGADDYLTKPFDLRELSARIRALSRRTGSASSGVIEAGDLKIDPASQSGRLGDRQLVLTRREFSLLRLLMVNKGRIVSKQQLFDGLFGAGDDDVGINAVELYVARVRKKLVESDVKIKTHRGLGYQLEVDQPATKSP